jgi:hypothetical protein
MIMADSSVWIDYFTGVDNKQTDTLHNTLGFKLVAIGDLILIEVLQGSGLIKTTRMRKHYSLTSQFLTCWAKRWH